MILDQILTFVLGEKVTKIIRQPLDKHLNQFKGYITQLALTAIDQVISQLKFRFTKNINF
ncbi:unnamed protein product [Acidithrix sp. C25]|nr:unnamed protein product [Acidithrix sp. C25]